MKFQTFLTAFWDLLINPPCYGKCLNCTHNIISSAPSTRIPLTAPILSTPSLIIANSMLIGRKYLVFQLSSTPKLFSIPKIYWASEQNLKLSNPFCPRNTKLFHPYLISKRYQTILANLNKLLEKLLNY